VAAASSADFAEAGTPDKSTHEKGTVRFRIDLLPVLCAQTAGGERRGVTAIAAQPALTV